MPKYGISYEKSISINKGRTGDGATFGCLNVLVLKAL